MSNGPLVVAYHGCDITTRDALITGRQQPKISANPYDWLGPGFYLFEGDPERALAFARTAAENPEYRFTARPIVTPAVVGCVFAAHSCLDMTTRRGRAEYTVALRQLELAARTTGAKMPVNKPAFEGDTDVLLRGLDRAVIKRDPRQSTERIPSCTRCISARYRALTQLRLSQQQPHPARTTGSRLRCWLVPSPRCHLIETCGSATARPPRCSDLTRHPSVDTV